MANFRDALSHNVPIVDAHGRPTPEFMAKWQQQTRINKAIPTEISTPEQVSAILDLLAATPGALLRRGAAQWQALNSPGDPDMFLNAAGGYSLPVPLDTRGQVLGTTGAALGALPPGANGLVLTADSSQSLGLRWAPGGGGSGSPVTADNPPANPSDWDDEFEYGSTLDTAGARRPGAKPWSFIGSDVGDPAPIANGWACSKAVLKATMPVPLTTFRLRGKFSAPGAVVSNNSMYAGCFLIGPTRSAGMVLYNNGGRFGTDVAIFSSSLVWSSDLSTAASGSEFHTSAAWYYEIAYDGTNIMFGVSSNGFFFRRLYTGTAATLIGGAPTLIAMHLQDLGSGGAGGCCDWIRIFPF